MSEPERCLILSSGRCGSTLLSNLIATEPETLSVPESLVVRQDELWQADRTLTGAEYWRLLSVPSGQWKATLRLGVLSDEFCYPEGGRWSGDMAPLPPILMSTLPALTDDPDALFDQLDDRVPRFPKQSLAQHYAMLFDLMAALHGRRRWVERSGGSSSLAEPLLGQLPLDKVVYLTRDMAPTAASMSRHSSYQFVVIRMEMIMRYGFDPYADSADTENLLGGGQPVPDDMRPLLPEELTRETLADRGGRIEQHKLLWAGMRMTAERALAAHPPRQLLRLRYEDLMAAPVERLTELAEFLGFADPAGWAASSATRVRPSGRPAPESASAAG